MPEGKIVTGDGGPAPQQVQTETQTEQHPQPSAQPQPAQPQPGEPQNVPQAAVPQTASTTDGSITWTASEFVAHHKTTGWYGTLAGVAVAIAALVYLFTRDIISTIVVIVAALAFGVIGGRQPRQLRYQLSNTGVIIGQKQLAYGLFKSFSVVPEGAFSSIVFRPLKRFAPLTTIYYSPDDEDRIIRLISLHLPFEDYKPDPVDNMLRRIRF
jgi:hypothetical protein